MTVQEAIVFMRCHGIRIRWTPSGQLSAREAIAAIVALASQSRGRA